MAISRTRVTLDISSDLADFIAQMAKEEGVEKSEIWRRGLSCIKFLRDEVRNGRPHIGTVADPANLDVELTGLVSLKFAVAPASEKPAEEEVA